MTDPHAIRASWRALGQALAEKRRAAKLSQQALGDQTNYSRSSIANIEAGLQHVNRSFWESADAVVNASGELVRGYDVSETLRRECQRPATAQGPSRSLEVRSLGDRDPGHALDVHLLEEDGAGLAHPLANRTQRASTKAAISAWGEDPIIMSAVVDGESISVRVSRRALLQAARSGAAATLFGSTYPTPSAIDPAVIGYFTSLRSFLVNADNQLGGFSTGSLRCRVAAGHGGDQIV